MASSEQLSQFANKIGEGPFGLALYRPESWANATMCFDNVLKKVDADGGTSIYGWMFQLKLAKLGEYFIAIHHAVWRAVDGHLFDITPYHAERINQPLTEDGGTLFLVDRQAKPFSTERMLAPLASRFFALGDDPALVAYVDDLARDEQVACQKIYDTNPS